MTTAYDNLFRNLFDEIFSESAGFFKLAETSQPSRFNRIVSTSQFPPSDVICDTKTKKLTIKVALAGYSDEEINLSFDGDYLKLIVNRLDADETQKEGSDPTEYYIQRGIRFPKEVESRWVIDPRYYSRDNVSVTFKNGLLTIEILPREEVAPKQIALFGKLSLDKKDEKKQIE